MPEKRRDKKSEPDRGRASDKTARFVEKEKDKQGRSPDLEKGRPKDTGRVGA